MTNGNIYSKKSINSIINKIENIDWSRKNNKNYSRLHSISSYLAMFVPSLPQYFIDKYSKENDLIMDNFSGRGTTALVSREMNRKFVGNDLNPYAFVISKLKVSKINKEKLLKVLEKIENKYFNSSFFNQQIDYSKIENQELSYFYSDFVLRQLFFIRETYGKTWLKNNKEINAILAFALGLMHGPSKKDGTTIYFSLKSTNTISMAPNYVKNYSQKHNLIKPNVDIFQLLKKRIETKFDDLLEKKYEGKIYYFDSTKKNKNIKNNSISLVITSPPYLSIVNYTNSNWLRLWLLGYDRKTLKKTIKLSDSLKEDEYVKFIQKYLLAIHSKLKNNAKVCLVIGDVKNKKLIEDVWEKIKSKVPYKFKKIYYDQNYLQTHKSTNMLNSRSGKATKIEKVLVLEKK